MWQTLALSVVLFAREHLIVGGLLDSSRRKTGARLAVAFRFQKRIAPVAGQTRFTVETVRLVDALLALARHTVAITNRVPVDVTAALARAKTK